MDTAAIITETETAADEIEELVAELDADGVALDSEFIVQTAAAQMPSSCWGIYKRIGLLEVDPGMVLASMISPRARGVRSVLHTWERLHAGGGERTAFAKVEREADALCEQYRAAQARRRAR